MLYRPIASTEAAGYCRSKPVVKAYHTSGSPRMIVPKDICAQRKAGMRPALSMGQRYRAQSGGVVAPVGPRPPVGTLWGRYLAGGFARGHTTVIIDGFDLGGGIALGLFQLNGNDSSNLVLVYGTPTTGIILAEPKAFNQGIQGHETFPCGFHNLGDRNAFAHAEVHLSEHPLWSLPLIG